MNAILVEKSGLIIETKAPTGIGAAKSFEHSQELTWECAGCEIMSAAFSETLLEFRRAQLSFRENP